MKEITREIRCGIGGNVSVLEVEREVEELILPKEPETSEEDDVLAMMVEHEYRLTLLELGVN